MQTVRLSEKSGSDGVLRLRIPVERPEAEYDAVVVVQLRQGLAEPGIAATTTWPAGYFEQTFGSISDTSFDRPPQGDVGQPPDLE